VKTELFQKEKTERTSVFFFFGNISKKERNIEVPNKKTNGRLGKKEKETVVQGHPRERRCQEEEGRGKGENEDARVCSVL
jgi:hypothetical protein